MIPYLIFLNDFVRLKLFVFQIHPKKNKDCDEKLNNFNSYFFELVKIVLFFQSNNDNKGNNQSMFRRINQNIYRLNLILYKNTKIGTKLLTTRNWVDLIKFLTILFQFFSVHMQKRRTKPTTVSIFDVDHLIYYFLLLEIIPPNAEALVKLNYKFTFLFSFNN